LGYTCMHSEVTSQWPKRWPRDRSRHIRAEVRKVTDQNIQHDLATNA